MFSEATNRIYKIESDVSAISSRISQCENSIYNIQHDIYDSSPLWSEIDEIKFHLNELIATVHTLSANVEDLSARICKLEAAIRPQTDVKTAIPNQKSDLEILKQNSYIDLEDVKNEKGIWELYDENWYNK